jgi:O-antigen/teichoic acid export membrane protein
VYGANVFVAAGLLIHKRTRQMSGMLVIAAALNIGLNCLLLPRMGLMGGALATLISYLVCIAMLATASNLVLPLHTDLLSCTKYLFCGVLAWLVGSRITAPTALGELIVKSAAVFAVYLGSLYLLDERTRGAVQWILQWVKKSSPHRLDKELKTY